MSADAGAGPRPLEGARLVYGASVVIPKTFALLNTRLAIAGGALALLLVSSPEAANNVPTFGYCVGFVHNEKGSGEMALVSTKFEDTWHSQQQDRDQIVAEWKDHLKELGYVPKRAKESYKCKSTPIWYAVQYRGMHCSDGTPCRVVHWAPDWVGMTLPESVSWPRADEANSGWTYRIAALDDNSEHAEVLAVSPVYRTSRAEGFWRKDDSAAWRDHIEKLGYALRNTREEGQFSHGCYFTQPLWRAVQERATTCDSGHSGWTCGYVEWAPESALEVLPESAVSGNCKFPISVNEELRTSHWRRFRTGPPCWPCQQGGGTAGCMDGGQGCC